jgi:membrane protease YdiL (CAAX protease family)
MLRFMRRFPLSSYFVLTFALSWGAVFAVIGSGSIPAAPDDAQRLFPFVYLAMLVGPVGAGLIMTGVAGGVDELRNLGRRLLTWRVDLRWFAVALCTAPVVLTATWILLSQLPGDFTPAFLRTEGSGPLQGTTPMSFLALSLCIGMGAGFFEEIGWTGFVVPRLLNRGLGAILFLGAMWGAWHFLVTWWGSADAFGSIAVPIYLLVALFSFLPPYRILMVWVYQKTGSLLVAVLMHASLTSSMLIMAPAVTGIDSVLYNLAFAGLLWCLVSIVGVASASRTMSGHSELRAVTGSTRAVNENR